MDDPDNKRILEEAVRLFLQLEASPNDTSIQAEKDAFLARGDAEKAAYEKAVVGWKATGIKPRNNTTGIVILAMGIVFATLFVAEPVRIALIADQSTGLEPSQSKLKSGDVAYLDAGSAIVDDTEPEHDVRTVEVLKGAAFFEVAKDDRPFRVMLEDIQIDVVGTAFETAIVHDMLTVDVAEGIVSVANGAETWQLEAGDRLVWSKDDPVLVTDIAATSVANWRQDQLAVENMLVTQVVDILDRRIPGDVMIVGDGFANKTISGNFDLSDPIGALNILAATQNARIVSARPLGTLLIPRN